MATGAAARDRARAERHRELQQEARRRQRQRDGQTTKEVQDDWAATADDPEVKRYMRKRDADDARKARELYDAGRKDQREADAARKAAARKAPAKKALATKAAARKAPAKKAARAVKRAPAQVKAARTGSVAGIFTASVALVALYVFLEGAGELAGFLGGVQRAIRWLASPTAVIPYKKGT